MDFVQSGHGCRHHIEFRVEGGQYSRLGNHPHREVALPDGDNLLTGDARKGSERCLRQPTIQTALPKLLTKSNVIRE